ncbi:ArsR/SmtB family transcription factor [Halegenticoccus soli]|uniref:ArsR/SmtB family transcription factor n=1 Tax=Halegenticoccus soli TaxID=1985678 RepID=UPI000C6CD1B9|nr:metalloregulator ArsR/SmtB family transcription factor [Halegenticoccus soli]
MPETTARLRRLIADEIGECCESDVERRIETLSRLAAENADADGDVRFLSAVANGTRYRILRLLAASDDPLCVCELTPLLDVSESAISHALAELRDAGAVERRKEGRWRYYRSTERGRALVEALDASRGAN